MRRTALNVFVVSLFLCLILQFSLFANGSQEEGEAVAAVDTIRIWTVSGAVKDVHTAMIDEYNSSDGEEKGIQIEYTNYGDDYTNILKVALAADQGPDIFKRISSDVKAMIDRGWILPIDDMPGGPELIEKYEGYLVPLQNVFDGKTYSLPYSTQTFKLVYNKDLFKKAGIVDEEGNAKPPVTWDEVVDAAKKITAKGEETEYGYMMPLKWGGYPFWALLTTSSASYGDIGYNYEKGKFDFTKLAPIFKALIQMREDGSVFPGAEGLDNDTARAHFSEGNVGMMMGVSWDVGVFNDQFPAKCDWGAAAIPVVDPNDRYKEYGRPSDFLVLGTPSLEYPKKALDVYAFMQGDEMLSEMYSKGKLIPYKKAIVEMTDDKPTATGFADFADMSDVYLYPPGPRGFADKVIEGDSYKIVFQKIILGMVDIEEGLADITERRNEALEKVVENGTINLQDYIIEDWYEKNRLE
jgi:multiple sugar transport system substrate-binding protein